MTTVTKTPARLDREITEALADPSATAVGPPAGDRRPLYGHTSEATAYLVGDYPYGFHERTQIRYWLEEKPKKGWRLVSQTKNPKTGRWNKPKASTYAEWGGAMYLDDEGHVQWDGIGRYSDDRQVLSFVRSFPQARTELREVVPAKLRFLRGRISGQIVWTVNRVAQPTSEAEIERLSGELKTWEEIGALVGDG
jgi:hypothetical protein